MLNSENNKTALATDNFLKPVWEGISYMGKNKTKYKTKTLASHFLKQ